NGCSISDISFFFQAEDGIRDFHVTGVQTCALPIFIHRPTAGPDFFQFIVAYGGEYYDPATGKLVLDRDAMLETLRFFHRLTRERSEERRVGKEWRARWPKWLKKRGEELY